MIVFDLLMLTVIVCFIIDISGIIESIEWYLSKWLGGNVKLPKPFNCSLCSTFWLGLIYTIIYSEFTLVNFCIVSLFAAFSEEITNTILIIKQLISKVQNLVILLITDSK